MQPHPAATGLATAAPRTDASRHRPRARRSGGRMLAPSSERDREDPLHQYLAEIRHIPVLEAAQEVELAARMRAALGELRACLASAPGASRSLLARWQELREAGRVTGTLCETYRADGPASNVRIDAGFESMARSLARRERALARGDAVAEALGLEVHEVNEMLQSDGHGVSLDGAGEDEEGPSLSERLVDEEATTPDGPIDDASLASRLDALLELLEPREREILERRFGMHGVEERTLQALGSELGLSRERVRQIEKGALQKLAAVATRRRLREHVA